MPYKVPRSDGYVPISKQLFLLFSLVVPSVTEELYRYILSAGRRLDAAHHQFERTREELTEAQKYSGSQKERNLLLEAVSDCELGLIAMNRAFCMAYELDSKLKKANFHIKAFFPLEKTELEKIKDLRDAFEHIDDRAFNKAQRNREKIDPSSIFNYFSIIKDRKVIYGPYELSINREATNLMIKVANYLLNVGAEICSSKNN